LKILEQSFFKDKRRANMIQIAIDGPGGAGKSTVAKAVAAKLGIVYVDTGALYRTIGYFVRTRNVDPDDREGVAAILGDINIEIRYENGAQHVYLNGEDLGDKIRTPEMSMYASKVSAIPAVRAFLLDTQRDIAKKNSVIMDGRDIGTVILPNADVKIFLTASEECRAMRRYNELIARGQDVKYEDVLAEMNQRDKQDSTRDVAPTAAADDAVLLDNTGMTFDQTVDAIIALATKQ
jgi:cytidylate kinase